ncbi:hypothetical protein Tco_0597806 [Tanacetum coccineum]
MSFDPRLLAYVESPICILAFDSIFVVILFDCCNPWSSLISLNRGSFDVIIGMDWLSKRKFVIVCHEKVVRIPLEGDEILRVHGERTQGVVKTLMKTKVDEPKLSDIRMRFIDVFPKDLSMTTTTIKEVHGVHLKLVLELLRKDKLYAKKGRVKLRRVRAMSMTIQSSVKDKILATSGETSKVENKPAEMLRDLDQQMEKRRDDDFGRYNEDMCYRFGSSYHLSIRCAPFEALYGRKCRSPVLWAEVGESSLIGPELVQEMTDKVVLIKEKFKAARDRQKSYADNSRKPLEFEVGNRELIGPVVYRLRLPEELSGVHDTFHVSNLKKCLADASLHVPLDEIKVDKTLRFVEEPVENSDREVKRLKCSRMVVVKFLFDELQDQVVNDVVTQLKVLTSLLDDGRGKIIDSKILVKVRWNSKRGPEFTWEREDYMKSKYPQLFVGRADESAS